LGPNITWNEIALESTDEPITTGIDKKLPWLSEVLVTSVGPQAFGNGSSSEFFRKKKNLIVVSSACEFMTIAPTRLLNSSTVSSSI
jgi:hypothetical protein